MIGTKKRKEAENREKAKERAKDKTEKGGIEETPSPEKQENFQIEKKRPEIKPDKEAGSDDFEQESDVKTEEVSEQEEISLSGIEDIMQQGLEDAYKDLSDAKKQEFKTKGEKTAREIFSNLNKSGTKPKEIVKLISSWLKVVPDFNQHYIEQSAKNKTDKLFKVNNKEYDQ